MSRRARGLCALMVVIMTATPVCGFEHYLSTTIRTAGCLGECDPQMASGWASGAWVETRLFGVPFQRPMENDHSVYEDNNRCVAWQKQSGLWSDWQNWHFGGSVVGHCYNSHLISMAGTEVRAVPSSPFQVCWYGPPVPPTSAKCGEPLLVDGVYVYIDPTCETPILISLKGGAYRLTSVAEGVSFDIRGDGDSRRVAWTQPGLPLAFLALDRNLNGRIDDGSELFGSATRLESGRRAAHGFEAMAELDVTGDGTLDAADPVWKDLILWVDSSHDGLSDAEELVPVADTDVQWIATGYTENVKRHDQWGNMFRFASRIGVSGQGQSEGTRPFYDVVLQTIDQ